MKRAALITIAFAALFGVLLLGGLTLNTVNLDNAPLASEEPSLSVGYSIELKEVAETGAGTVYRIFFVKEPGGLSYRDVSGGCSKSAKPPTRGTSRATSARGLRRPTPAEREPAPR